VYLRSRYRKDRLGDKIRIIFRVEGNSKIGMGHLMRCLALAEEIERRSRCDITFLMKDSSAAIERISKYGYKSRNRLGKESIDIIITSLPEISGEDSLELKKSAKLLVCLDDSKARRFSADIVIRGSIVPELRNCDSDCKSRFFLGENFMILNKEFQRFNKMDKENNPEVKSILITMGGGDVNNLTPKIMAALGGLKDIKKTVIVGPAFEHIDEIKANKNYTLKYDISNMAELMFSSDMVIAGGGLTLYELASVGVPGIVLCQTEYQLLEANSFEKKGIVINLGLGKDVREEAILSSVRALLKDKEKRSRMSLAGKKTIDAKAVSRVATEILKAI